MSPVNPVPPGSAPALDAFFDAYYGLRPVNATFTGVHDYDAELPDWSPDGLAAAADELRTLRAALGDAPDARTGLADVAARDRALAASVLDVQIAELAGAHFERGNPSLAVGEAVFGIISLVTRPFAPATARADAVIGRLLVTPVFLRGARASMPADVPEAWRAKALEECAGADRLLDGLARWIAAERIDNGRARRITESARTARGAVSQFREWLISIPPAPAGRYAAGADLFDVLLARGHWCRRSRRDLLIEAQAALDEALARVDEQARQVAPDGWPEVQARLADHHPPARDYLATYQQVWDACQALAKARDLVTWPDYPIRYVPIPPHTREAAPLLYYLFYRAPSPFDALPVHEYVVTPIDADMPPDEQERRLRATNMSVIKLNHVVHHGAIGHHVQNHHAYHGASQIGRVAAVDCASRIGMFCGGTMAEGWACYATDLMEETGFLTPEERVAQQHTRARLLARAVADVGLHQGTLSFEDVVAMYRDRIGMSPDAARREACKNSMFPGTAVMYWLGTDSLHRLRRACERRDGPSFSLRRFHDGVLSHGSIPVPLVAELMS